MNGVRMANSLELLEAYPHQPEADSFNFRRAWARVRHAYVSHKRLVAGTCVFTIALTLLYVAIWPPIYVAKVEVVGESEKDQSRDGFYQNWAVFRKEQLSDEVQMFTAGPVLAEVVHRMKLTEADVYHPFFAHLGYLWNESLPGRAYHGLKKWLFPPTPGPYTLTPEQEAEARAFDDFKAGVKLDPVQETDLGNLTVAGPTPRVADMANMVVTVYMEQRRNRHMQEAQEAYDALDGELRKTRDELDELENRMREYYTQNSLLMTFEKDKIEITRLTTLEEAIADLRAAIAANEQSLAQVNVELGTESKSVQSSRLIQRSAIKDNMRNSLSQLEISRKQTLVHFRSDSPEIAEIDRQIAILQEQLDREPDESTFERSETINTGYEALRSRKSQLETDLAGQRASLDVRMKEYETDRTLLQTIPEKMRVVHEMDREHTALEAKYGALQEKLSMAAVSRATAQSAPPTLRVIAPATPPGSAAWPKTKLLVLMGGVFGLAAGMVAALLVDLFFGRVHRYRLIDLRGEQPVYALIRRDSAFVARVFALPGPDATTDGRRGIAYKS